MLGTGLFSTSYTPAWSSASRFHLDGVNDEINFATLSDSVEMGRFKEFCNTGFISFWFTTQGGDEAEDPDKQFFTITNAKSSGDTAYMKCFYSLEESKIKFVRSDGNGANPVTTTLTLDNSLVCNNTFHHHIFLWWKQGEDQGLYFNGTSPGAHISTGGTGGAWDNPNVIRYDVNWGKNILDAPGDSFKGTISNIMLSNIPSGLGGTQIADLGIDYYNNGEPRNEINNSDLIIYLDGNHTETSALNRVPSTANTPSIDTYKSFALTNGTVVSTEFF